jgi:hypothetical protein
MEMLVVLKGISLVSAALIAGIFMILTYEVAETGSFEDACINITNLIRGFIRR